jgi:hypothetical protein
MMASARLGASLRRSPAMTLLGHLALRTALLASMCRARLPQVCTDGGTDKTCKASIIDDGTGWAGLSKHQGERGANYNPEWMPGGFEGAVDTAKLPWIELPQMPGTSMKPLRVSRETGAFTVILKTKENVTQPSYVLLGAMDTFVLSGKLSYPDGPLKGEVGPGVWGYAPAGVKVQGSVALEDTECLHTFHGGVAFPGPSGEITGLLTGPDVIAAARKRGVPLLPMTLEEAMGEKPPSYPGEAEPLAAASEDSWKKVSKAEVPVVSSLTNPYFVDTNALPWIVNPDAPEIALKVMRISTETGIVSLIVRQNGQAPPHYHLGASDFLITSGRLGYRAGPPEGFGPGTYIWEPAGARHESTNRVNPEEDLIYTANLYGPIQFDSGPGTPPVLVQSWMQYLAAAKAANSPLLASTFHDDHATLLAPAM